MLKVRNKNDDQKKLHPKKFEQENLTDLSLDQVGSRGGRAV